MGAGNGPEALVLHKQALTPDPGRGTATWGSLTLRSKSSLAESGAGHRGGRRQTPGGRCSWRPRAHRTDQIRDRPGHLLVPRPGPQDGGRWAPRLLCPHPHRHHPTVPRTGVPTGGRVCGTDRGPSVFRRVHRRGSQRPRGPGQLRAESRPQTRHGSYLPGQHRAGHTDHHTTATRPRRRLPSPG